MKIGDLKWLAGFFESRGSFIIQKYSNITQLRSTSYKRDIMYKIKGIAGGTVHPIKNRPRVHGTAYMWGLHKRYEIENLLAKLYPYMGIHRQRDIKQMLAVIDASRNHSNDVADRIKTAVDKKTRVRKINAARRKSRKKMRREVKRLWRAGIEGQEIARKYKCTTSYISHIIHGRRDGQQ